jgi:beta-glucosidase
VLFGSVDPSGRLPVTFPASGGGVPGGKMADRPGVDGTVDFAEGLDIGYRYDVAHHITPLFPFGFGLSYTGFRLAGLRVASSPAGETATVRVTDTGPRAGAEVVQTYLSFPSSAGEPPIQLVAFGRVSLRAGQSKLLRLDVAKSAFEAYLGGTFTAVPGDYTLRVGTSSAELPLSAQVGAPWRARAGRTRPGGPDARRTAGGRE